MLNFILNHHLLVFLNNAECSLEWYGCDDVAYSLRYFNFKILLVIAYIGHWLLHAYYSFFNLISFLSQIKNCDLDYTNFYHVVVSSHSVMFTK